MEDLLPFEEIWEGVVRSRAGRKGGRPKRQHCSDITLHDETPPTAPETLPKEAVSWSSGQPTRQGKLQATRTQAAKKAHPTWIPTL